MERPLVSVIVPVYGIERYVGACIESILAQTYENLEVILVDDGGTDRCPALCDLYAKKDARIRVIHKPNGGLVSARKAGLRAGTGAYVSYVDGDDRIGPGFIEALYRAADGADAVCAGFTRELFDVSAAFRNALPTGLYEGERLAELRRSMISCGPFYRPGIATYLWNKLFRREVLWEPQLAVDDRISIGEDGAAVYPALLRCRRVAVTDDASYRYRQREDSMLKQTARYAEDARKLRYLYRYLTRWAEASGRGAELLGQVRDYVLSIALIRSGGRTPQGDFSAFGTAYYGKRAAVFSAGTFGQQLVNRIRENGLCRLAAWVDDDYREYRRCCLDVDPVESVTQTPFDYILLATADPAATAAMRARLTGLGVGERKILALRAPEEKERLLERFLSEEAAGG